MTQKTLALGLIFSLLNLAWGPSAQAFWGQNLWQNLSANIFTLEEELPSGLFFDWEAAAPENSFAIAFQNSDGLINTFTALKEKLQSSIDEVASTEEGALLGFFAGAYLSMLEDVSLNAQKIQSAEVYFEYDLDKLQSVSELYKSSLATTSDLEALADFESMGLCVAFRVSAHEDVINRISDELKSAWTEGETNFSVTKQNQSIEVLVGCDRFGLSLLENLPPEVNLVAYQSGFDYESFYDQSAESEGLDKSLNQFYNRLRELNSQRVSEDLQAGAFLLSLQPGGHKTQLVASLSQKSSAEMLQKYWSGSLLKTPFFMNEKAGYKTQLLTFSGEAREYVFFEEDFTDLDWTHWYGKVQEISLSLMPALAILGTVGFTGLGNLGPAEASADTVTFIQNASTVLRVNLALSPEYQAPASAEDVRNILLEQAGLEVPITDDLCYYYIHSLSRPHEFAVFSGHTKPAVAGSEKMSQAVEKIFAERDLSCATPQIKGSLILNLSQ